MHSTFLFALCKHHGDKSFAEFLLGDAREKDKIKFLRGIGYIYRLGGVIEIIKYREIEAFYWVSQAGAGLLTEIGSRYTKAAQI